MSVMGSNIREARYVAEQAKKREADLRVLVEELTARVGKLEEKSNRGIDGKFPPMA